MKTVVKLVVAVLMAAFSATAQTAPENVQTIDRSALATVAAEITMPEPVDVAATVEADSGWLEAFTEWIGRVDDMVWGVPLIGTILVTGILLTALLRFVHLFNLKRALRYMVNSETDGSGEVSSFGALCTALSATIGTGNIVGVATAVGTGGPGALFWMEVAAFFGMATKYAEGLLAVKYREVSPEGKVLGGPFYYIEKGLGRNWKWLAVLFAVFGVTTGLLGIGTITQVHGITSATLRFFDPNFNPADATTGFAVFGTTYSWSTVVSGLVVTACVALVVIGGLKRISKVSTIIVPFMAVFYVTICAFLLFGNLSKITAAVELVVRAAFNPEAFTGGMVGTMLIAMQKGVARGIFSNEAGLGSAPIAAAAATTKEPVRQGLICMTGTFIDTIVICTMTGLAIVVTGAWEPELGLKGVDITIYAFTKGLAFLGPHSGMIASFFLMVALAFFAFTTILGWDYYSEKCLEYLVGSKRQGIIKFYRLLYVIAVFIGPYLTVSAVWSIADTTNGLMAFPNLVALVLLSPTVVRLTRDYFRRLDAGEVQD
ncbi:MAG: alanine:cation symporter family protein [Kiritimatiellae bacterium]|nr:alanine:cation symporter family protein [Kiritimatiellia bacterium]